VPGSTGASVSLQCQRLDRRSTSQRIGSFEYTTFDDGSRATTQHIGSFSYTRGDGVSATTQRIGSSSYLDAGDR
jgi:hypothetical protein